MNLNMICIKFHPKIKNLKTKFALTFTEYLAGLQTRLGYLQLVGYQFVPSS